MVKIKRTISATLAHLTQLIKNQVLSEHVRTLIGADQDVLGNTCKPLQIEKTSRILKKLKAR